MAMTGLFRAGLVEWVTSMTYQAASGAGAKNMRELIAQMGRSACAVAGPLADPASAILDIDRGCDRRRSVRPICRQRSSWAYRLPEASSPGSRGPR
jgi:aspartate-semialdehyde dehydrogenase